MTHIRHIASTKGGELLDINMTNEMVNMFLLMLLGCFLLKSKILLANRKVLPAVNSSSWFTSCPFQSGLRSHNWCQLFLRKHNFLKTATRIQYYRWCLWPQQITGAFCCFYLRLSRLMVHFLFKAERTWSAP